MQIHQNTRKKHPKLSLHPFHDERELLLRQAMQLIQSKRDANNAAYAANIQLKRAAAKASVLLSMLHMQLIYSQLLRP